MSVVERGGGGSGVVGVWVFGYRLRQFFASWSFQSVTARRERGKGEGGLSEARTRRSFLLELLLGCEGGVVAGLLLRLHRIIPLTLLEMLNGIIGLERSRPSLPHQETADENDGENEGGDSDSDADSSAESRGVVVALAEVGIVLLGGNARRREQDRKEREGRLHRHQGVRESNL